MSARVPRAPVLPCSSSPRRIPLEDAHVAPATSRAHGRVPGVGLYHGRPARGYLTRARAPQSSAAYPLTPPSPEPHPNCSSEHRSSPPRPPLTAAVSGQIDAARPPSPRPSLRQPTPWTSLTPPPSNPSPGSLLAGRHRLDCRGCSARPGAGYATTPRGTAGAGRGTPGEARPIRPATPRSGQRRRRPGSAAAVLCPTEAGEKDRGRP